MKFELNRRHARNLAEFRVVVQKVSEELDIEGVIDPLVRSFQERLMAVAYAGGKCIKPWMSGDLMNIADRVPPNPVKPALWKPWEDKLLDAMRLRHFSIARAVQGLNLTEAERQMRGGATIDQVFADYDRNDVHHRMNRLRGLEWEANFEPPRLVAWCPRGRRALLEDGDGMRILPVGGDCSELRFETIKKATDRRGLASDEVLQVATTDELEEIMFKAEAGESDGEESSIGAETDSDASDADD
jgi:hypothetical protein